jgi:hypothetical protein
MHSPRYISSWMACQVVGRVSLRRVSGSYMTPICCSHSVSGTRAGVKTAQTHLRGRRQDGLVIRRRGSQYDIYRTVFQAAVRVGERGRRIGPRPDEQSRRQVQQTHVSRRSQRVTFRAHATLPRLLHLSKYLSSMYRRKSPSNSKLNTFVATSFLQQRTPVWTPARASRYHQRMPKRSTQSSATLTA